MLRDVLGHRIRKNCYFEFVNEMEKYYIYKDNAYQIIRMSKHYKLDGGWYVDILIRNIDTNKVSKIFIPYKTFKEKTLFNERPRKSLYYVKKKDKSEKEVKLINESLNFTNEVGTYFKTKQDFINFNLMVVGMLILLLEILIQIK